MKHEESVIQSSICQFLQLRGIYFFSVPNERNGSVQQMTRLVSMGMRAGISDLVLVGGDGRIFFLEIKTKTGKLSESQNRFIEVCQANGWVYGVARSVDDAAHLIDIWGVVPYTRSC